MGVCIEVHTHVHSLLYVHFNLLAEEPLRLKLGWKRAYRGSESERGKKNKAWIQHANQVMHIWLAHGVSQWNKPKDVQAQQPAEFGFFITAFSEIHCFSILHSSLSPWWVALKKRRIIFLPFMQYAKEVNCAVEDRTDEIPWTVNLNESYGKFAKWHWLK